MHTLRLQGVVGQAEKREEELSLAAFVYTSGGGIVDDLLEDD